MKKRLACMILAISVIVGATAFAQNNTESTKTFTLEQAIEHAINNSRELRAINGDIKKLNTALKEARDARRLLKAVRDLPLYYFTMPEPGSDEPKTAPDLGSLFNYDSDRAANGYYEKQIKQTIELLERQKEQTIEKLKYDLQKLFYDIELAEDRAESLQQAIERLEKQIEVEELKIKLGMSMDFVLDMAKNQKDTLENQLNTLNYGIDSYYALLRSKLDLSPTESVEIIAEAAEYQEYTLKETDEAYKEAQENRLDMLALKQKVELLELDMDILKTYYTRGFNTYKNTEIDLARAKDDYSALQKGIEDRIKLLAEDVKIKQQEYKNKKSALETEKYNYSIAQLKFDLGMISKLELEDEQLKLKNAEIDAKAALQNYTLAVKMYEISYGPGY